MFPVTVAGRVLGAAVGFLGICVFALPVGILGAGFVEEMERRRKLAEPEEEDPLRAAVERLTAQSFKFCPHCGENVNAGHEIETTPTA